jgi:tetratricopeptide (TPR) repeat protein
MNYPGSSAAGTHNVVSGVADVVLQARDIDGDVHVHRAAGRELPIPRQLPGDVRGFVGRQRDLEQLDALLRVWRTGHSQTVVVSAVTGTAGVGKTALTVHWAHRVREHFPDGQLYLNLCGYDPEMTVQPAQALHGFLQALDIPVEKIPRDFSPQAALYRSLMAGRRMLVVLDNAASADQVRPLLPGTASCLVLITSRSSLAGLVAREGIQRMRLDLLSDADATALLRTIIGAERADAEPAAIADLARLCVRLPLALRVAAERALHHPGQSLVTFVEELTNLRDRLDTLATNDDDETTAVRAVFSWSYRALPGDVAEMYRLLGLHPGPQIGLHAAAALSAAPVARARQLLDRLVAAHLLEQSTPDRYQFHDLLRAYAVDVVERDEPVDVRRVASRRVLDWYLHTAAAAVRILNPHRSHGSLDQPGQGCVPLTFSTPDQALSWCEVERDNLVAAVHAAAAAGELVVAWKLPIVLWNFFDLRKHWSDWIDTHRVGVAAAQQLGDRHGEAWITDHLGIAYFDLRQADEAMTLFSSALDIRRDIGDRRGEASTLGHLGTAHRSLRQLPASLDCLRQALAIRRDLGDRRGEGHVLNSLGSTYRYMGQFDAALDCSRQALAIRRAIGDRHGEAWALNSLANVFQALERHDEAVEHYRQALVIRRAIGDRRGEAETLYCLGRAQHQAGHSDEANMSLHHAVTIFDELGSPQAHDVRTQLDDGANGSPQWCL